MAEETTEPEKKVEDAVPTKAEETTPEPEVAPPAVNDKPDSDLRGIVEGLQETVSTLAETVSTIVAKAEPDSTPVKRPWTHWGSR